jgi:predicted GNAT family acetyltransferase
LAEVTDDPERARFELAEDGQMAFAAYSRNGTDLVISHVEAPPALRGQGTASRLMEGIVAKARANGLKVIPLCSYAALWFRRHPDQKDMLR